MLKQWLQSAVQPRHALDLTANWDATIDLLGDTWAWRQRLVETVTLHDAHHVRVESSYQVQLPASLLARWTTDDVDRVRVLLPLTTRQKTNLLRFEAVGPQGVALHLLPRAQIATLQVEHLDRLCNTSDAAPSLTGLTRPLLYAICWFSPDTWQLFEATHGSGEALRAYLRDGLQLPVEDADVARWLQLVTRVSPILTQALAEPPLPTSSSEQILLALPAHEPLPQSIGDVDGMVENYVQAVVAAHEAGDQEILMVLAEYGRRYEVVLDVEITVESPVTLRLREDRPLKDPSAYGHRFPLGDAASAHLEVQIADHNVVLTSYSAADLRGRTMGIPLIESSRFTGESIALYSSDPGRPYYADVTINLRLSPYLRWVGWGTLSLVCSAVLAGLVLPRADLPLVVLPVTFAATLVLTRADTPLAAELQRALRRNLGLAILVLWLVVLVQLGLARLGLV